MAVNRTVVFPDQIYKELKEVAERKRRSIQSLILVLVEDGLDTLRAKTDK